MNKDTLFHAFLELTTPSGPVLRADSRSSSFHEVSHLSGFSKWADLKPSYLTENPDAFAFLSPAWFAFFAPAAFVAVASGELDDYHVLGMICTRICNDEDRGSILQNWSPHQLNVAISFFQYLPRILDYPPYSLTCAIDKMMAFSEFTNSRGKER